ncbi:MATE efflux family protein 9 [Heracleum sosnowskyi]|uniref:MATE efflux family protein 9 n=1 Tax=Heracleum sosnowskyi TaxID=360622 RepID=A0AAD8GZA5_9APIA|nr:MATE efflux family protein 9 [Heracleum sosnowskyi]
MGMSGAMETFCGQSYHMLGIHIQRAMFVLLLFSSSCAKSWTGFSMESLQNILTFLRLAVPSGILVCLELWSFEMMVLLSGLLPNPQLETSVLSIRFTTAQNCWMIPFGLGASVSTRVSNELGASHPQTARLVRIFVGVVLLLIRHIWGYAYNNEVEVVQYVATMMPILATPNISSGITTLLHIFLCWIMVLSLA